MTASYPSQILLSEESLSSSSPTTLGTDVNRKRHTPAEAIDSELPQSKRPRVTESLPVIEEINSVSDEEEEAEEEQTISPTQHDCADASPLRFPTIASTSQNKTKVKRSKKKSVSFDSAPTLEKVYYRPASTLGELPVLWYSRLELWHLENERRNLLRQWVNQGISPADTWIGLEQYYNPKSTTDAKRQAIQSRKAVVKYQREPRPTTTVKPLEYALRALEQYFSKEAKQRAYERANQLAKEVADM